LSLPGPHGRQASRSTAPRTSSTISGLAFAGEDYARAIQLGIEYDPQPPFDSGSTAKASPEIVELLRGAVERLA
jgi:hypothetical protein